VADSAWRAPRRVVVAGDWHGDTDWAVDVISGAAQLLESEEHKIILHCGDFGIWPGAAGAGYVDAVIRACSARRIRLRFVDGNHEDFTQIEAFRIDRAGGKVVGWLPRGYRWTWHGRSWIACGGGVSLDRVIRTEGRDWWPEEEITDEQEAQIIAGGGADVMISHDRPTGVLHEFPDQPRWWAQADIDRSRRHEQRLQRIVTAVQPRWLIHGHLHRAYFRECDLGYGKVRVTGLNCNREPGNAAVLDITDMTWETVIPRG